MSDLEITNAKFRILDVMLNLNLNHLNLIESWISTQTYKKDLEFKKSLNSTEKSLVKIGNAIKNVVPFEAEMESEKIVPPIVGDQADCNSVNTYHVDEFLYDEDEVEKLINNGKLRKHFCSECHSRNVKELTLISHSMSRQALQYIFSVLLPKNLEDKQILDVGSRIGAVIFGAYYFSNAFKIIGVEMNKECCEIQEKIIHKFSLNRSRIKVANSDIMERVDLIVSSHIIVVNVLDFFVDIHKHKNMWYFFKKHVKKDTLLICNRSMADTLQSLEIYQEFIDWLEICKPNQLENEIFFYVNDFDELYLYKIK